jgi:hypothetical protein
MAGLVSVPTVEINFVPAKEGETFQLGPIQCRIMEDGSRTGMHGFSHCGDCLDCLLNPMPHSDNRIGVAELTMPPRTPGLSALSTVRFHGVTLTRRQAHHLTGMKCTTRHSM